MHHLLPSLPLGPNARWAIVGSVAYLAAGLVYFAETGTPLASALPRPADLRRGQRGRHIALGILVLLGALVVWPAAPVLRARRSARSRPPSATAPAAPEWPQPPLWFRTDVVRVDRACQNGDRFAAARAAAELVERTTAAYGAGHPFALDAVELMARISHRGSDDIRAVLLYLQVAGRAAGDPTGTERARSALRSALALWSRSDDQAALYAGPLLLAYVRVFFGRESSVAAAAERRLDELLAARLPKQPAPGEGRL